jgi:hypothetical protein
MNHVEPVTIAIDGELEERLLWIGPDGRGLELEVVAIVMPEYVLVIHVMPTQLSSEDAMSAKYVAGPDVDLDHEVVRDKSGRRITERLARQIAEDTLHRAGAGRPSLTGPGRRSPEVKARVPEELRERLHAAAEREHTSSSELIRKALEQYLAS